MSKVSIIRGACWIKIVYDQLAEGKPLDSLGIPHHSIFYIRSLLQEKFGVKLSTDQVEALLLEEGLMPLSSYVPAWYARKYLTGHEQKLSR